MNIAGNEHPTLIAAPDPLVLLSFAAAIRALVLELRMHGQERGAQPGAGVVWREQLRCLWSHTEDCEAWSDRQHEEQKHGDLRMSKSED